MPEQRWPIGTTFDPIRTYDTGIGQIEPNLVRYLRGAADTQTATTPATQEMVPVDPSFRDRLEMLLSDTFGHTPVGRRRANMFMDAFEWIPGVDEGLLFSDAGEEIEQGNLITGGVLGGLGALSMAPFVPPGAGRSLEEIMKSLKKKVKKRPDDTPVIPDSGEGKRYDSNLPVSDHAQGRRTREADIRRQQELDRIQREKPLERQKRLDRIERQGIAAPLTSKPGLRKIEQALRREDYERFPGIETIEQAKYAVIREPGYGGPGIIVDTDQGITVIGLGKYNPQTRKKYPFVKTFTDNTSLSTLKNWLGYE